MSSECYLLFDYWAIFIKLHQCLVTNCNIILLLFMKIALYYQSQHYRTIWLISRDMLFYFSLCSGRKMHRLKQNKKYVITSVRTRKILLALCMDDSSKIHDDIKVMGIAFLPMYMWKRLWLWRNKNCSSSNTLTIIVQHRLSAMLQLDLHSRLEHLSSTDWVKTTVRW